MPLFWRVDLDIRASSIAADDSYDAASPAARSDAGWSRPASAVENAVAAIKTAVRGQAMATTALLSRGYERINAAPSPDMDLPGTITRLADACAALEPGLADTASDVHQAVAVFTRTRLLPMTLAS
ncbi:MAG TPA: hypothetical protein VGS19_29610 [Streptosporangiaceae bacterium]|nr:hypothetical protein [Streptosporangiaceae bacterium]